MTISPLEEKLRPVVNAGKDSLVLAEGHKSVLIVTRHLIANKIKRVAALLRKLCNRN